MQKHVRRDERFCKKHNILLVMIPTLLTKSIPSTDTIFIGGTDSLYTNADSLQIVLSVLSCLSVYANSTKYHLCPIFPEAYVSFQKQLWVAYCNNCSLGTTKVCLPTEQDCSYRASVCVYIHFRFSSCLTTFCELTGLKLPFLQSFYLLIVLE